MTYDDFAYVQMLQTGKAQAQQNTVSGSGEKLDEKAFAFFDWDGIYRELLTAKARQGYCNLAINKQRLIDFAYSNTDWYTLKTRKEDVTFDTFSKLANIERLFRILILAYMEQFYKRLQTVYEDEHMEMRPLNENWIPDEYVFEIDNTQEGRLWDENLRKLQQIVAKEDVPFSEVNHWMQTVPGFVVIAFKQHLYTPLFYDKSKGAHPFTYKPVSLGAASEEQFVRDLQEFYNSPDGRGYFENIDLYLMRNAANKLKGIGFAQAGNFYPDFMLWLIDKITGQQYLTFIDPKGLRNHELHNDPKINFCKEIKELEKKLNEGSHDKITLNSVILSTTSYSDPLLSINSREFYDAKHILFLEAGWKQYMPKLFSLIKERISV